MLITSQSVSSQRGSFNLKADLLLQSAGQQRNPAVGSHSAPYPQNQETGNDKEDNDADPVGRCI